MKQEYPRLKNQYNRDKLGRFIKGHLPFLNSCGKNNPNWKGGLTKNKEHRKKMDREYQKKRRQDPIYRLNENMACAIWYLLRKKKANKKWSKFVGYSAKELKASLEKQFTPKMNWDNYGSYWEIDHIKPISLFRIYSPEDKEFKECWSLDNLQPLEKSINRKKHNRYETNVEYPRLYNQLRIHYHWLRKTEDYKEIYKILRAWLNTDEKIKKYEIQSEESKER